MAAKKFVPKVEQLAQIQLELDVEEEKKGKVSRLGKIKEIVSSSDDLLGASSSNDAKSIQDMSNDNDDG